LHDRDSEAFHAISRNQPSSALLDAIGKVLDDLELIDIEEQ
jgi:hypothetical protein